jgi:3-oxoadipate enol-lactonase
VNGRVPLAWDSLGNPGDPAVVLVHSLGADRTIWESLAAFLRGSHQVIRLDLRGHGASPSPSGPYSIEQLSDDVLGVADAAGLSRFHVCGISLGGLIGLFLAARRPERLLTLVAANTAAKIGSDAHWNERCRAVRASGMAGIADTVIGRWFAPGFLERDPVMFAHLRNVFAATNADAYVACCQAIAALDLTAELARIDVPALIVGGELDASTPVASARQLHAGIRGSRLVVLPEAAHLSNLDVPAAFDDAVGDFLLSFASRH